MMFEPVRRAFGTGSCPGLVERSGTRTRSRVYPGSVHIAHLVYTRFAWTQRKEKRSAILGRPLAVTSLLGPGSAFSLRARWAGTPWQSLTLAVLIMALTMVSQASAQEVPTPRIDVTDTYHGVTVHDPYRWLEDAADPKVAAWTAAQNQRTRAYLDALPSRTGIRARLASLITRASTTFYGFRARGDKLFAIRNDPSQQQPALVVMDAAGDTASAKAVIDPNTLDPTGKTTIDWYRTSPDGKLVAVSLSQNGSEIGTLHVYEVATGKEIGEPIPRVQAPTAGGSLAWLNDSSAFWYARYPGEEKPEADRFFYQQVYFHTLGGDWRNDPLVLGEKDGLPRVAEIFLGRDNTRDFIVAQVQDGDGGEFAHFVLSKDGVVQLAGFKDQIVEVVSSPRRRDFRALPRRRAERQGAEAAAAVQAVRAAHRGCARARSQRDNGTALGAYRDAHARHGARHRRRTEPGAHLRS